MADLDAQVRQAVALPWRYATVDIGVGDLCAGTPLGTFRARLKSALTRLSRPAQFEVDALYPAVGRDVLVLSIEDLVHHWQVLRADPIASRALQARRRLDCGLGYSVTRTRLAQIRKRTIALNKIIATVCKISKCRYDAGTHFLMPLQASYFSTSDPRYLSVAGQRALAGAEWKPARALIDAGS